MEKNLQPDIVKRNTIAADTISRIIGLEDTLCGCFAKPNDVTKARLSAEDCADCPLYNAATETCALVETNRVLMPLYDKIRALGTFYDKEWND